MTTIWQDNLTEAKLNYQLAKKELKLAELQLAENKNKTGIEKWLDYSFESSSVTTPEYKQFEREIKSYIKKSLSTTLELSNWLSGHFEFSGFIKNKITGLFVYFSGSDVRIGQNAWYADLLIRTAENENDYTGGSNNSCQLSELSKKAEELTK